MRTPFGEKGASRRRRTRLWTMYVRKVASKRTQGRGEVEGKSTLRLKNQTTSVAIKGALPMGIPCAEKKDAKGEREVGFTERKIPVRGRI